MPFAEMVSNSDRRMAREYHGEEVVGVCGEVVGEGGVVVAVSCAILCCFGDDDDETFAFGRGGVGSS